MPQQTLQRQEASHSSAERREASTGYLRCSSGGLAYGVPVTSVRSVDRPEQLEWNAQPSGPDAWVRRATGKIPVYGISSLLKIRRDQSSFATLVDLHGSRGPWALGFDRVERFDAQIDHGRVLPLPPEIRTRVSGAFQGVATADDQVVLCLDLRRLDPDERDSASWSVPENLTGPVVARPPVSPAQGTARAGQATLIRFQIPGIQESIGLSAKQVIEFVDHAPAAAIPGANPALPGVVIWRGQAIPVLDLSIALHLQTEAATLGRVLIVRVGTRTGSVAIPTGASTPRLQSLGGFRASPAPSTMRREFLHGSFADAAGPLLLPNLDQIVRACG
jgi:chemotaxis signal transduction protein